MNVDNNNINNIQKALKKLIFSLGFAILFGTIILVVVYYTKKQSKSQNTINPIVNKNCKINNIIYKDKYVSLESKNCNKITIINIDNFNSLDFKTN